MRRGLALVYSYLMDHAERKEYARDRSIQNKHDVLCFGGRFALAE